MSYALEPIGVVRSPIVVLSEAPLFYTEGAPNARIELEPRFSAGLLRMKAGDEIIVVTWLHLGRRDVLEVHPRGDAANPLTGVFSTRSPDRPNPLGLHRVRVLAVYANGLDIGPIEVVDGTPVVDIKPVVPEAQDF